MHAVTQQLGETYAALRSRLGAYLRRQVGDPVVAEDLLQQVFLKALTALRAGRAVGNLTGWLYSIARTAAIDHHRSRRTNMVSLDDDLPAEDSAAHQLQQELATCLGPLAEQLPPIYRDTLISTDFQGQSMRHLADQSGLSVSAVKSRASRARALLKARLLECCDVSLSGSAVVDYERITNSKCEGLCARQDAAVGPEMPP